MAKMQSIIRRAMCAVTLLGMTSSAALHQRTTQQVFAADKHLEGMFKEKYSYTVTEQDDTLCDAGTRQWTGSINVTDKKSIFFWFVESRNDPDTDPVVLWLNGGPASSSMPSVFNGGGPCRINGESTYRNKESSWTNWANMLYIDQPAGSGFSLAENGSEPVDNLDAGARDLNVALLVIFRELFVNFQHQPLHITGESYGGHYVPYYAKRIKELQAVEASDAAPLNLSSIVLFNAFIEHADIYAGQYEVFCNVEETDHGRGAGFNATVCKDMANLVPHCLSMGRMCKETYDGTVCRAAAIECQSGVGKWFEAEIVPGGRSPYDKRIKCEQPPLCSDLGFEATAKYLNLLKVQEKLGFHNFSFTGINFPLNGMWTEKDDVWLPTTRELQYLLDTVELPVLVVNGNTDIIINTPGTIRIYDQLEWSGQAPYRLEDFRHWKFVNDDGKTRVGGSAKSAGRLTFIDVDEAGHQSGFHQPLAVSLVMDQWTKYSSNFQKSEFLKLEKDGSYLGVGYVPTFEL